MCAITGWINLKGNISGYKNVIEEMSAKMASRGPDSSGAWFSPHVLLAHRRLAVMDPAGGHQPMIRRRDGHDYCIVYNGELYNATELKKDLEKRGYIFSTSCDTEVLLVSYMNWGEECVKRLNGIFAFGLWDERKRQIFLARDHFGVKPLFYAFIDGGLIFASEIKALLAHPFIKPVIDAEGLAEIFALGPARTPGGGVFKGISELKPAHCMTFGDSGAKMERYWALQSHVHEDDFQTTVMTVRDLVVDSVKKQCVSDVPLCAFLSGGLDSSAISALASSYFKENGKERLNTYSVDYVDNEKHFVSSMFQPDSDAPWAARMSDFCGSMHHSVKLDSGQVADALVDAMAARDLPGMADIDSSLWLFCREVKKDATVALSGECADEVFGGYPWFHRDEMLHAGTFPWARDIQLRLSVMSGDLSRAIKPEDYITRRYSETISEVPRLPGENKLDDRRREVFYLNFAWFMQTLLDRKDRMSMAHGLEVRVPFCDYRLVQYAWNIPWDMKMLGGREKGILRKSLEGLLPDGVLYRKKSPYPKTYDPAYELMVKKLLNETLNDHNSPLLPLVNRKTLLELISEKSNPGKPWFGQLMALPQLFGYLVQVDAWLRMYKISVRL